MMQKLFLAKIDIDYCEYLRKYDYRVPIIFDKKVRRPFVGIIFKVKNIMYFAPLSSPKAKHLNMNDKIDFLKINKGKLGAINFNNMVPVLENNINKIELNYLNKYDRLLIQQINWLNLHREKIYQKSSDLYYRYLNRDLDKRIINRCCNFQLLEEKCIEYNKNLVGIS